MPDFEVPELPAGFHEIARQQAAFASTMARAIDTSRMLQTTAATARLIADAALPAAAIARATADHVKTLAVLNRAAIDPMVMKVMADALAPSKLDPVVTRLISERLDAPSFPPISAPKSIDYCPPVPIAHMRIARLEDRVDELEAENMALRDQLRFESVRSAFHGERLTTVEDRMTETEDYLRSE